MGDFFFRNCAFVNFTNITSAIKAIEGFKSKPEYANLRIAHGKDRCANPPRSGPQGSTGNGGGARRTASGNGPPSAEPISAIGDGEDGEMMLGSDAVFVNADGEVEENIPAVVLGEGKMKNEGLDMHVDGVEQQQQQQQQEATA